MSGLVFGSYGKRYTHLDLFIVRQMCWIFEMKTLRHDLLIWISNDLELPHVHDEKNQDTRWQSL